MPSDNLQLDDLSGSMSEKTNKVNEIFQQLEDALVENQTVAMADSDQTMSDADFNRYQFFTLTSSPITANRTLTIPARKKLFVVNNTDTSYFRIRILPSGGSGVWIYAGTVMLIYSDGSTAYRVAYGGDWIDVAATVGFASGNWSNVGGNWSNAEFRLFAAGFSALRGAVVNGVDTPPTNIFTLPVGRRPGTDGEWIVATSAGTAVIRIVASTGVVSVQSGTISTRLNLEGIRW